MTVNPRMPSSELSADGLSEIGARTGCDREPIHRSGAIQPHGYLLAVDQATQTVTAASENFLATSSNGLDLLGAQLETIFDREVVKAIRRIKPVATPYETSPETVSLPMGTREAVKFDLVVHRRERFQLLEFEEASGAGHADHTEFFQAQYAASKALYQAETVEQLCDVAVKEIRRLTQYDRVMIYRFDRDAHGCVVAEARADTAESFLGLNYPASDIPRQARLLYLRNWIRVIPDVDYTPVPLFVAPGAGGADQIDLSMCVLRSVSPFHLQYLRNMGIRATMTISLIVDNQLWGMIACHHNAPKRVEHLQRLAYEALGQQLSVRLRAAEKVRSQARAQILSRNSARVVDAMVTAEHAGDGAAINPELLLAMVAADGAVVEIEGQKIHVGEIPAEDCLAPMISHLADRAGAGPAPWHTDNLPGQDGLPFVFCERHEAATGAMFLPLAGRGQNFILWFRRERAALVRWAGKLDVSKDESLEPLQPRASFAEWLQQVRGWSLPWLSEEIASATELAQAMPEILMHRAQNRLVRMALYDSLTGLPNRMHLFEHLEKLLGPAQEDVGEVDQTVGVIFIDLDGFKAVNDTQGHEVGDELLKQVGRKLSSLLRSQDFCARLGGDEFVVVLPRTALEEALAVGQRIVEEFHIPIMLNGQLRRYVTLSVGVTTAPRGVSPADALKQADTAMYHAKRSGRDQVASYDTQAKTSINPKQFAIDELRNGIAAGEIVAYFQPVFDILAGDGNKLIGFEALARWRHPQRGVVPPSGFIELAEEADLIGQLGRSILLQSLRQMRRWSDQKLSVAVNVSVQQLVSQHFADEVLAELLELGLDPARLCLEITETQMMQAPELSLVGLNRLKVAGVQIAIDDFGTGFSSLAYVRNLPASILKIDRKFVMGLPGDLKDDAVIKAIVELAHLLGMRTVAEGVETVQQLEHLTRLGSDFAQGYLLGRPTPPEDLASIVAAAATEDAAKPKATPPERQKALPN